VAARVARAPLPALPPASPRPATGMLMGMEEPCAPAQQPSHVSGPAIAVATQGASAGGQAHGAALARHARHISVKACQAAAASRWLQGRPAVSEMYKFGKKAQRESSAADAASSNFSSTRGRRCQRRLQLGPALLTAVRRRARAIRFADTLAASPPPCALLYPPPRRLPPLPVRAMPIAAAGGGPAPPPPAGGRGPPPPARPAWRRAAAGSSLS